MLKTFLNLLQRGYGLWDRVNRAEAKLDQLQTEQEQLHELVTRLIFEQQRDRENAAHGREKLHLQLENALLKFERRLPPAKPAKGK